MIMEQIIVVGVCIHGVFRMNINTSYYLDRRQGWICL